jgi:lipopolysaccharide transport system ATP-binding protein
MSSEPIITVENLSKRYRLGSAPRHTSLRDSLSHGARNLLSRLRPRSSPLSSTLNPLPASDHFWALRDVNFSINRGDVVGIVGRNGAGKSTLLKILSRITEPTTGRITLHGRVASLLEVGTGFHGELSGRENIFLNGAILGMTRAETRAKFDEIVAFAEVEQFLDTPVKRYSSGMYVRLAFAVAAHLEPEILIVDEVLAVGDAAFQKKCLGKMREVSAGHGRTVLFVSHNTSALLDICQQGLWLDRGRSRAYGPIRETIASYLATGTVCRAEFSPRTDQPSMIFAEIDTEHLQAGDLVFNVGFRSPTPLRPPVVGIHVYTRFGQPIFGANTRMTGAEWSPQSFANGVITGRVTLPPLRSDTYRASFWLGDANQDYDYKPDALTFDYIGRDFHPRSPGTEVTGPIHLPWQWDWRETPLP